MSVPERWLVDGNNVMGSRPDGWWADRPAAMERIVALCNRFHEETAAEIEIVFDGAPQPEVADVATPGVTVRFAGTESADDTIARLAARAGKATTVVTSDRELAERVEADGAQVLGAGSFRSRLESRSQP